jgi:hypothetical protein
MVPGHTVLLDDRNHVQQRETFHSLSALANLHPFSDVWLHRTRQLRSAVELPARTVPRALQCADTR